MRKLLCLFLFFMAVSACSKEEAKAGSDTCTYGKQGDDFYMSVDIAYDKSQVVNRFTFTQYLLYDGEHPEEDIDAYHLQMNQFGGVSAEASLEGKYIRYHYTVNLNEYNMESDVLGVILEDAKNEKGNLKVDLLKESLSERGYSCE